MPDSKAARSGGESPPALGTLVLIDKSNVYAIQTAELLSYSDERC